MDEENLWSTGNDAVGCYGGGLAIPVPAHAAVENGWETVDGMQY